jgi:hypothetical protein
VQLRGILLAACLALAASISTARADVQRCASLEARHLDDQIVASCKQCEAKGMDFHVGVGGTQCQERPKKDTKKGRSLRDRIKEGLAEKDRRAARRADDIFAVGIAKCDPAVASGKRCKWDNINCYEQRTGRYGQETWEPVSQSQCRGESVEAFLDACVFWIRRGRGVRNCPTREQLALAPYANPPSPAETAARTPAPADTELVIVLLANGTCAPMAKKDAPAGATILPRPRDVLSACGNQLNAGLNAPVPRTPTPTVNAPTPRTTAPAQPACPAGFVSTMRLGMEWCGSYVASDEACRQAGGGITKDMTAAGAGRNLCLVRPAAATAPGAPAARALTPPTVKAPEVRAPTLPSASAPRTPAPTPPNTTLSGMTPRCQQLVTSYVAAARAKDGPRALAGYQALKAAGGCGVLQKVDRPQPRVRAPSASDSRFISRGATPNTDQVVGSCDASPAECAARVRQLQAGTSPEAKAALYSHAFSVGWQLGTMIGTGVLMAVPPSVPRTAGPTTAAPSGVRNTYGQGSPLRPAPRTRQSDITGTK